MEMKDWLGLLVPLIGDGLIIYFLHFYFERHYQKEEKKSSLRITAIKEYRTIIGKAYKKIRELVYEKSQEEIIGIVNEVVSIIVHEAIPYFNENKKFLGEIKTEHESLIKIIEYMSVAQEQDDVSLLGNLIQQLHPRLEELSRTCLDCIWDEI